MVAVEPKCPNSKCKKSSFAVKEVDTGTSAYRAGIVYRTSCGRIIGLISS